MNRFQVNKNEQIECLKLIEVPSKTLSMMTSPSGKAPGRGWSARCIASQEEIGLGRSIHGPEGDSNDPITLIKCTTNPFTHLSKQDPRQGGFHPYPNERHPI